MGLCGVLEGCDVGDVVWRRSGFGNVMGGGVCGECGAQC